MQLTTQIVQTTLVAGLCAAAAASAFAQADLSLSLERAGGTPQRYATYQVTAVLANDGPEGASGVTVAFPRPDGIVYEGGNEVALTNGTFSPGTDTWDVGPLAPGTAAELTINYYLLAEVAPETYAEVATADQDDPDSAPGNGNGEVSEDDEAITSTLINGGFVPDLTLANLTLAEATVDSGAQLAYTFDIANEGTGSIAQTFLVQAYLSTDEVISSDDLQNGTVPTGNFAAGQVQAGVAGLSDVSGLAPGEYFLILSADDNRQVLESDDDNNALAVPFAVAGGDADGGDGNDDDVINGGFVPDLVVSNIRLAEATVDSGARLAYRFDLNNLGAGSIEQTFLVQAYLSTDRVLSADDLQNGTVPTGGLAGGQTVNGIDGLSDVSGLAPGEYFLILSADDNRQVTESNEANNRAEIAFAVAGAPDDDDEDDDDVINGGFVPDLVLSDLRFESANVAEGGELAYTFDITNQGTGSIAQTFLVQAYLSTDSLLSADDVQNGTVPTGNYAAGQTADDVAGLSSLAGLAPGEYFLILSADDNRQVLESDDDNNTLAAAFTIGEPVAEGPDLELTALTDGTAPRVFDAYRVTFTLANAGGESVDDITVAVPRPEGVVYTGGEEFEADQGDFSPYGTQEWTVGSLAAGASATLTVQYFTLVETGWSQFAEVSAASGDDVDSTPGNGDGVSAAEDDEVFVDLTTAVEVAALTIAPNPVGQAQRIELDFVVNTEATIPVLISSFEGRTVFASEYALYPGRNTVPVDLAGLPAGMYIIALPNTGLAPRRLVVQE